MNDKIYNTREGFDAPPEHVPTENDMALLAGGDRKTADKIICGLVDFVSGIVGGYVRRFPAAKPYEEDLQAEALLKLTQFVASKLGKPAQAPTNFISHVAVSIRNCQHDWLRQNVSTIIVPKDTQRRGNWLMTRHELKEHHAKTDPNEIFIEVWNNEFTGMLDDEEMDIIKLRRGGASVNKISNELGLHRAHVERVLNQIQQLYKGEDLV